MRPMGRLKVSFLERFPHSKALYSNARCRGRRVKLPLVLKMMNSPGQLHVHGNLWNRRPVPWTFIERYAAVLRDDLQIKGIQCADDIADRIEEMQDRGGRLQEDAWALGWEGIMRYIRRFVDLPHESFCEPAQTSGPSDDIRTIATQILQSIGREANHNESQLSDSEALKIGESCTRQKFAQYAEWLQSFYELDNRTVLFSVIPDSVQGGYQRVGGSVVIPVSENAYMRLRRGEMEDRELSPSDFQLPSNRILIHLVADFPNRERRQRSFAQMRIVLNQLASFCVPVSLLDLTTGRPTFLAFIQSGSTSAKRGLAYGFTNTRVCMPGTNYVAYELALTPTVGFNTFVEYHLVWVAIAILRRGMQKKFG